MTLSRSSEGAGAQAGFLCVGRDVTEQRHSQEMLMAALDKERTAADRLRRLDAAKNEFVSTVSHELRTPVTSIIGYTEMLQDGSVVAPHLAQLPMLATIARNGERLITICNDLLLLGGMDSGVTSWERDRVDLCGLLGHVEESLRPLLNGRRLDVTFDVPDEPVVVLGDRVQLERAVMNLMSNAVKFTEDHGTVGCRLEAQRRRGLAGRARRPGSASPTTSRATCSPSSSAPPPPRTARSPAPASGCRSWRASSRRTAGGSVSSRPTSGARPSPSACRGSAADSLPVAAELHHLLEGRPVLPVDRPHAHHAGGRVPDVVLGLVVGQLLDRRRVLLGEQLLDGRAQ